MDPEAMTEDIRFMLDPQPKQFQVHVHSGESRMTSRRMTSEGNWIPSEEIVTQIEKRTKADLNFLLILYWAAIFVFSATNFLHHKSLS